MKLVRDHIPQIIQESGKNCLCRHVNGADEHMVWLKEKIVEEAQEFIENPCYEEAADMVEVIKAFCHLNNLEWDSVLSTAASKQETHGGFYSGIILQKVGE